MLVHQSSYRKKTSKIKISNITFEILPFLFLFLIFFFYHPEYFGVYTLLDHCLKLYTTLWNIWTYQQLCKKITQLVYNFTQIVYNFTQVVYFFTQQLEGSYISQCCVIFLNSGLTVYFSWWNHRMRCKMAYSDKEKVNSMGNKFTHSARLYGLSWHFGILVSLPVCIFFGVLLN